MQRARTLTAAAALLAALTALPAHAADPKPAAAPHPAVAPQPAPPASKVATDLAHILATKEAWNQGVEGLSKMVQSQFSGHPGSSLSLPPGFDKKVRGEVEAVLPYETLVDIHARQLTAAYTEPELNELLAHYRSPVGQKWLKTMPGLSEKIALETQKQVDPKLGEVMSRLAKDVKAPAGSPAKTDAKAAPAKKPAAKPVAK
jgi:hypothetical protein